MRAATSPASPPTARPTTRRLLIGGLCAGAALLFLARCFQPDLPVCSYRCNPTEPRCPDEYECRTDGYCHLKGSAQECPYGMDLSPAPDLGQPRDQSLPPDQTLPPSDQGTDSGADL